MHPNDVLKRLACYIPVVAVGLVFSDCGHFSMRRIGFRLYERFLVTHRPPDFAYE